MPWGQPPPPPPPPTFLGFNEEVANALLLYCVVTAVSTAVGRILAPRWLPDLPTWEAADLIGSFPFFPPLAISACIATWQLCGTIEDRWSATNTLSVHFLTAYIARQVVSFPLVYTSGASKLNQFLMTFHHALSIAAFAIPCLDSNMHMHYFGCLDGCCEVTTIFLNNLLIFRAAGKTDNVPFKLNSVLLWLSFILFRVLLFPYWLYTWYRDIAANPAVTKDTLTSFELTFYPFVTAFLWVLSCFWTWRLTLGMYKALFGKTKTDAMEAVMAKKKK